MKSSYLLPLYSTEEVFTHLTWCIDTKPLQFHAKTQELLRYYYTETLDLPLFRVWDEINKNPEIILSQKIVLNTQNNNVINKYSYNFHIWFVYFMFYRNICNDKANMYWKKNSDYFLFFSSLTFYAAILSKSLVFMFLKIFFCFKL